MSEGRFIEVIKPGMLTLVQDLGRYGYQQFGVPVAGAMDQFAAAAANLLVGNDRSDAVLEMMMLGPELKFGFKGFVALTGADLGPKINGSPVSMWQTVEVKAGDVLSFGGLKSGLRGYLAVAGGIDTPLVMNSRSTYTKAALGGFEGRALKAGDQVPVGSAEAEMPSAMLAIPADLYLPIQFRKRYVLFWVLRMMPLRTRDFRLFSTVFILSPMNATAWATAWRVHPLNMSKAGI